MMIRSKIDRLYRSCLLTGLFTEGWGTPEKIQKLIKFRRDVMAKVLSMKEVVDPEHPIRLRETSQDDKNGIIIFSGEMDSPFHQFLPDLVEPPVGNAAFEMVLPMKWKHEKLKPVCIHLAGTGDHYFWRRRNLMAYPLAKKHSIGSIILENPFYGVRKPKKQTRSSLRNVSDLFIMGGSLMLECTALLNWLEKKDFGPFCLTGTSMGGYMASLAASIWPKPISLVPCLSGSTASAVYTEGVMSGAIPWNLLRKQLTSKDFHYYLDLLSEKLKDVFERGESGGWTADSGPTQEDVLLLMQEIMDEFTHMANYPKPIDTSLIIAVFAALDAYVPREKVTELKDIWTDMEIRQIRDKGHIAAVLYDQNSFRQAIMDSLHRNAAKYYHCTNLFPLQLVKP